MNALAGNFMHGRQRARREVVDVPEQKAEDKSLDKLINVRRQRIDRLERERAEARAAWRASRVKLREAKERWRASVREAKEFWQNARAEFFRMTITSGQFRKAKAIYERMKTKAEQLHLECGEAVQACKGPRAQFFEARRRVIEAYRDHEKLGMLRDEIKRSNIVQE